jgi:hypothetical protein
MKVSLTHHNRLSRKLQQHEAIMLWSFSLDERDPTNPESKSLSDETINCELVVLYRMFLLTAEKLLIIASSLCSSPTGSIIIRARIMTASYYWPFP